jgi:hypothetical protein
MGYRVETSGRILLPAALEPSALAELKKWLGNADGAWDPGLPADTLADLARFVGADLSREGEWVSLWTDRGGSPAWSEQATAFYRALGPWVSRGEVQLRGEDGAHWAYRYADGQVEQVGVNGWDRSGTPADPSELTSAPLPQPPPAPAPSQESAGPAAPAGSQPFTDRPPHEQTLWEAAANAPEPPPAPPGRTVKMVALLVGGVIAIVGLAMLAADFAG